MNSLCPTLGAFITLVAALSAGAAEYKLGNHTFTLPDGLEVQQVAGPPLVERPITADFDESGRLYVTDSSGSNDKVEKQLAEKPHRVVRLEDTDGDGKFDQSVVFADKMMFPEGSLWFEGSLYVTAPPSIWKLTDTNDDGVADQRVEWFQGKTLTGCANDLHGPYLGLDGWIYWCKGAFAKQTHERPGKKPFVTRAAHIFRARPDGTGVEAVMTGGMDNPVDVVFTPEGERIFTTTFFQHPGGGQRDGLIHAVYGGVYGKVHDVIEEHPRTGDVMPVLTHMGPAAPCGLVRYESTAFGDAFRDNLFACQFNLHKLSRHVLSPHGATFKSSDSDFLVSDNVDFHPTDVLEDADGSLLIVDTGGWYKLCCPTSQLWKPDVLGAIYRVRRPSGPRIADPRGMKLAWATLKPGDVGRLLGDDRPAVRHRALRELAKRGAAAVGPLQETLAEPGAGTSAVDAVWALTRIDAPSARAAVRRALRVRDEAVRHAAALSAGLWRDAGARDDLLDLLDSASAPLQRAAAEALGRMGDAEAVPGLLGLAAAALAKSDRVLEHSAIFALIEIGAPDAFRKVGQASSLSRPPDSDSGGNPGPAAAPASGASGTGGTPVLLSRAALIALDQMEGGGLKPEQITPLLDSTDPVLKETAQWIASRHSDWGDALAAFFRARLFGTELTGTDRTDLQNLLARFTRSPAVQELLAATVREGVAREPRLIALRIMARSDLKEAPASWLAELTKLLSGDDSELVGQAVAAVRNLPLPKQGTAECGAALQRAGRNVALPTQTRLDALAAVPGGLSEVEPALFDFLSAHVAPEKPVANRGAAAAVLAKAKLSTAQLLALTESVKTASPLDLPRLLSAFESSTNGALGLKVISALQQAAGSAGLRPEVLRPRLTNFPAAVQQKGEELLALLHADAAKQKAHLDELASGLKDGDVRRGQTIFNSAKAACSACHAIGYLGGNLGPDLTRIGQVRTERDLLESILYPSVSFVRSYEPVLVLTRSGEEHSGVLRKDAPEEVVLGTGPGAEVRLARTEIAEVRPGTVSVMPAGLDEQLSRGELADLLAFLKATRW